MADIEKYAFSFSHAIIKANDKQYSAISNVSLNQEIDRSAIYGTSRNPLKRSAGQLQLGEGSLTFSDVEQGMQFIADLGDDPSLATFSVDVTLSNTQTGQVRSYEALSCSLSGLSVNFETGADALSLEIPFDFMRLKVDGKEFAR
jgi:hypothetical protein